MEIFDALVVISSFILDVVFLYDDVVGGLAQLIIFLRFWRVIRIINGLILGAKQAADKRFSFQNYKKSIKSLIRSIMYLEVLGLVVRVRC